MRLFTAVRPPATVLAHLERALEVARGPLDPGDSRGPLRWTAPEDRHLTLAFYGEVPDGYLPELTDGLAAVAASHPRLDLRLRGAGVFDHRTLWIGCGGDVARLARLSAACVELGEQLTGRPDHRVRSRAHLTVARVRAGPRAQRGRRDRTDRARDGRPADVTDLAHALSVYAGPTWTVSEVLLVSSRLGEGRGGGPLHEVVARAPLAVAGV